MKNITLQSGKSSITLQTNDERLYICELVTANGMNTAAEKSEFALPAQMEVDGVVTEFKWKAESVTCESEDDRTEAVFIYRDSDYPDIRLAVRVIAHMRITGPFEFVAELTNGRDRAVRIYPTTFASAKLSVGAGSRIMAVKKESGMAEGIYTHFDGQHYDGKGIYVHEVNAKLEESIWCNTFQNWNVNGYFPMVYLQGESAGAYCALEWSSGRVVVKGEDDGTVAMAVDMDFVAHEQALPTFTTLVPAGKTFAFPAVYLGVYDGSTFDSGSNLFKKWFFTYKVPRSLRENPAEPYTQMDMLIGLQAADIGVDAIKWDYGWWSAEARGTVGNWSSYEGSWTLRHPKFIEILASYGCKTIKEFAYLAKERGLDLTIYVLLHDTLDANEAVTDRAGEFNSITHPAWFSSRKIDRGMGNSADLGNEECVAFLQKKLYSFFAENGARTWRSDFEPISFWSENANRHDAMGSDVQYWNAVGFRELVTYLIDHIDGFRYECCSSGGSIKDLFTATLASAYNSDDAANYLSLRATFYDSSYVIHPTQLQLPFNADNFNPKTTGIYWPKVESNCADEDYDFTASMIDMGMRSMVLGVPMFSSSTGDVLPDYISKYTQMYDEKIRPLVRNADLYHILPRPDGVHWDGVMYAEPDTDREIKGAVFLFKPSDEAGDQCHVTLDGLDPDRVYRLAFEDRKHLNTVFSGRALMEQGIFVSIRGVGSEIIWITETKEGT